MSYNGIGLKSAKGSSTSGHVQRSLASDNEKTSLLNYKARKQLQHKKDIRKGGSENRIKKLSQLNGNKNKEVVEARQSLVKHLSKRDIELQVSELRDRFEDDRDDGKIDITDDEIAKRCDELRQKLNREVEEKNRLSNLYKSRKQRAEDQDQEEEEKEQES